VREEEEEVVEPLLALFLLCISLWLNPNPVREEEEEDDPPLHLYYVQYISMA
jgi:hypothetical protein